MAGVKQRVATILTEKPAWELVAGTWEHLKLKAAFPAPDIVIGGFIGLEKVAWHDQIGGHGYST